MPDTPAGLAAANWRRLERLRMATAASASALWERDDPDLDALVAVVLAGQRSMVHATDGGLSLAAGLATGTSTRPAGIDPAPLIGAKARNGVTLETAYARSLKVRREDGFQRGLAHLRRSIYTDMQLAQRAAANAHAEADNRVTGWRRQINPAAGGKTCGFCIAASTRVYARGDLLPLHPMCRCTVVEVYVDQFSGPTFDRERLSAVYARSGGATDRATLGRIRFDDADIPAGVDVESVRRIAPTIVHDAELGPTLTGTRHDTAFTV